MKHLLVLLLLLCSMSVSAQDVIVMKDGSTILSKVLEVGQKEVKYKKFDNLEGPTYSISKSELQAINYQNGAKDTFSEPVREENRYLPNNQNDGTQQYNDRALLQMDAATHNTPNYKRAATITKVVGWGIGAAAVGTGIYFLAFAEGHSHYKGMGAGIAAGGAIWATGCLVLANYLDKKSRNIESASIYQHNFTFTENSSLSAGIDMLSDRTLGSNSIGLGLRYNF